MAPSKLAVPAGLLLLALSFGGCVPVPMPGAVLQSFPEKKIGFIKPGSTTRADVVEKLGPPTLIANTGSIYYYEDTRTVAITVGIVPSYGSDVTARDHLLIRFDERHLVTSVETIQNFTLKTRQCTSSGICIEALGMKGGRFNLGLSAILLAPEAADTTAKKFQAPANGCSVYIYFQNPTYTRLWLDTQPAGVMPYSKSDFFYLQLAAGPQEIVFSGMGPIANKPGFRITDLFNPVIFFGLQGAPSINKQVIDCRPGQIYFLGQVGGSLRRVGPADGRAAIGKRELALHFFSGGVRPNLADTLKARPIFVRAWAGDATAQYRLSRMFGAGADVPPDPVQARKWLRVSAQGGNAAGQYAMSRLYLDGAGVDKDEAKALGLIRQAADQNHGPAEDLLGQFYFTGNLVGRDYAQALAFSRRAADRGLAAAQYRLGTIYAGGLGIEKDNVEALKWYILAAGQGHEKAWKARHKLESWIGRKNQKKARKQVASWNREHSPAEADGTVKSRTPRQ